MKNVSSDDRTSLSATIQAQIMALGSLKDKVDSDTDATSLKSDVKSITGSYRIYALVIPQGHLLAAIDSVNTVIGNFGTLDAKLDASIAAAKTAGKDTTAAASARADIDAKLADARVQVQAAHDEIVGLKPDQNNDAQFQANKKALQDARAKIKAATADLKAARADVRTVTQSLGLGVKANATSTASASE
jgi:hypothetical protein